MKFLLWFSSLLQFRRASVDVITIPLTQFIMLFSGKMRKEKITSFSFTFAHFGFGWKGFRMTNGSVFVDRPATHFPWLFSMPCTHTQLKQSRSSFGKINYIAFYELILTFHLQSCWWNQPFSCWTWSVWCVCVLWIFCWDRRKAMWKILVCIN